jgi:hypothetical protein
MKTLTIDVPDNKYGQFLEVISTLGLDKDSIHIQSETQSKQEILDGLKEAVEEMNLILAGKKKGTPLKDFLNEL